MVLLGRTMFLTNGKDLQWLGCCWCPAQPKPIQRTGRTEYDNLRALAQAKAAGWRVGFVCGQWQGICPECQKRDCDFNLGCGF